MEEKYQDIIKGLEAAAEDAPSSWMYDRIQDAIDAIEELASQREGWRVVAGGETFTTYDRSVAEEWARDGLDVEKFFVPLASQ